MYPGPVKFTVVAGDVVDVGVVVMLGTGETDPNVDVGVVVVVGTGETDPNVDVGVLVVLGTGETDPLPKDGGNKLPKSGDWVDVGRCVPTTVGATLLTGLGAEGTAMTPGEKVPPPKDGGNKLPKSGDRAGAASGCPCTITTTFIKTETTAVVVTTSFNTTSNRNIIIFVGR